MTRKKDDDIKKMSLFELRRETMKLRKKIRWHRNLNEDARCHHCDDELYTVLPEVKPAGKMTLPVEVHLGRCWRYILRQQCELHGCTGISNIRKRGMTMAILTTCSVCGAEGVTAPANALEALCNNCRRKRGWKPWEEMTQEEKVEDLHRRLSEAESRNPIIG